MNKLRRLIGISVSLILFTGCAGLGSVKKTNDLIPGMDIREVKRIMGEPSQTQFIANKFVLKYNLHQYFKGWVPYYLAFDRDTLKLETWYADEAEYYRDQQLWIEAMPKQVNVNETVQGTVHHEVSGTINHNVSGTINVR